MKKSSLTMKIVNMNLLRIRIDYIFQIHKNLAILSQDLVTPLHERSSIC